MTFVTTCAPAAAPELDIAIRELARVSDLLAEFVAEARALADGTDWRSRAATAFHDKAERWVGDVSALGCLAETARLSAVSAQAAARARAEWCTP